MPDTTERRNSMRMDVNCEIYCKLQGTETSHKVLCITLSGNGISFISEQAFELGATVEVDILTDVTSTLKPMLQFFITIVRCQALENGSFDVGATIQLPEETN
jgi:hypothetical protein